MARGKKMAESAVGIWTQPQLFFAAAGPGAILDTYRD